MVILIMGVSGAGKTTIGRALAAAVGFRFADADDFHPPSNIEKMRRGLPLDDVDRAPWLRALAAAIGAWQREGADVVLACSALKAAYREELLAGHPGVSVLYLKISPEVARARVAGRVGHFFKGDLVDSQLRTLEEPDDAIVLDASQPPEAVVEQARAALGL